MAASIGCRAGPFMKVLVTGISGQVGRHFSLLDTSGLELLGTYHRTEFSGGFESHCLDITDAKAVSELLGLLEPDWVIHCAAATNVDRCEEDWKYAESVNVRGTENVARACSLADAKMLLISTDYVFDGKKGNYREEDPAAPIQAYGKSKLLAEQKAGRLLEPQKLIIARSAMVYSALPNKFLDWIEKGLERKNLSAVDDVYCSPTLAEELADCTLQMVRKNLSGVYHAAGAQRVSKYEFVRAVVKTLGYDPNRVGRIKQKDLGLKAMRLVDASLDISKLTAKGIRFSDLDGAMTKLSQRRREELSRPAGSNAPLLVDAQRDF